MISYRISTPTPDGSKGLSSESTYSDPQIQVDVAGLRNRPVLSVTHLRTNKAVRVNHIYSPGPSKEAYHLISVVKALPVELSYGQRAGQKGCSFWGFY